MTFKPQHGMHGTPEYTAWRNMIKRCESDKPNMAPFYKDRGITVCVSWLRFENFYRDMGRKPSAAHSLERSNNDKGYSPRNCKWATFAEQQANRRSTRNITFKGETMSIAAWARRIGMTKVGLWYRLERGESVDSALTRKSRKR